MPRPSSKTTNVRRSARLNKNQVSEERLRSKRRRRDNRARDSDDDDTSHSLAEPSPRPSTSVRALKKLVPTVTLPKRSFKSATSSASPPTPAIGGTATKSSLQKREQDLSTRESDLNARWARLEERLTHVVKKEEEIEFRLAQNVLIELEDNFSCSLCYEIIACPYTLTPGQCGHSFCALCILKWFLSRIHQACGGWHESVDCPICRSLLILTPSSPRALSTFPFTPNRTIDSFLKETVGRLANATYDYPKSLETPASPSQPSSSSGKKDSHERGGKKIKRESSLDKQDKRLKCQIDEVNAWKEGGALRAEWLKRDNVGRKEMQSFLANWCNLGPQDFLAIKARLGV